VTCLLINRERAGIMIHFFSALGAEDAGIIRLPDSCMVRENQCGVFGETALALWKLPS
jgi:hypothetical protein